MSNSIMFHVPVMVEEVLKGLEVRAGGKYIDATAGGGGHGIEILKHGGDLLGIDIDSEAVWFTEENFKFQTSRPAGQVSNFKLKGTWKIVQGNFRNIEEIAKREGFENVNGILFDLGVSSHQLDTAARGFSYRFTDARLDLRFDQKSGISATEIVNTYSKDELYELFTRFGEEQLAGAIADTLVRTRRMKPIQTTGDLVAVVAPLVKRPTHLRAILSRIFQALRIATNDELTNLREGLIEAYRVLAPHGRLAVISFHSLEDRIVKQTMASDGWHVLAKNPIRPINEEIIHNPRARSAKLRIAEKL